jgi:hypothetical protein
MLFHSSEELQKSFGIPTSAEDNSAAGDRTEGRCHAKIKFNAQST